MHVSANIIRFPSQPMAPIHHSEPQPQESAGVVAFPAAFEDDTVGAQAQQHGQFFAAHRIVSRVADELDGIAAL